MRRNYDEENENAMWRISIKRMFQSGDLEGLKDLLEGPEVLDDEIIEFLKEHIDSLEGREK